MGTDPRTLDGVVCRVVFWKRRRCSVSLGSNENMNIETGERWFTRKVCGEAAGYATVRRGRVHARCESHAREDAADLGVEVNEDAVLERPRRKTDRPMDDAPAPHGRPRD